VHAQVCKCGSLRVHCAGQMQVVNTLTALSVVTIVVVIVFLIVLALCYFM